MIECFFRSLKQECVWMHRFESRDHAFSVTNEWLTHYDGAPPHSALGHLSLKEFRAQFAT